jgi:acyl-CoA synthetase (AMP-forming)/AMP-acid ligase II
MGGFGEVLRRWAVEFPDDEAFTFLGANGTPAQVWSYGELDHRARRIAAALGQLTGSVLLIEPTGSEFVEALFGCFYAGRIAIPTYPPHPMNPRASLDRLRRIVTDARPASIATSTRLASVLETLRGEVQELAGIPVVVTDTLTNGNEDAADREPREWAPRELEETDIAVLQYTSGSTGDPRGVILTHGNLLTNTGFIARSFGHTRQSRSVTWLPPYHDMGLIGGLLQPVFGGVPCTVLATVDFVKRPLRWLRAIHESKATISGGPGFAYDLCVRRITKEESRDLDLSRWELAYNGSEPINPRVLDRFVERFRDNGFRREAFYPCYGLAESTLAVSLDRVGQLPMVRACDRDALADGRIVEARDESHGVVSLIGCGRPAADHHCIIVDPATRRPAAPDRVGEIWVRGPSVARGYWNREEETRETFGATLATGEGPFLRTGDVGTMIAGELFVTGRIKDVIIIRGRNHAPQDIEAAVSECDPMLRPACGVAFSTTRDGEERLVIVQEVESIAALNVDVAIRSIRRAVAAASGLQPDSILLLAPRRLPKTASGKLQRQACRRLFLAGQLDSVAEWHAGSGTAAVGRAAGGADPPRPRPAVGGEGHAQAVDQGGAIDE